MQPKIVIVTGSGRSGTSSVAGTLKRLGLQVPQPEVAADERNPRGYYEPAWVTEFHKSLLNPIPVRTIDARPDAARIAREAVTPGVRQALTDWLGDNLDHPQVLIKDPREFWVHDLWLEVAAELGAEVTTLTMLRHPTEVVRSRDTAYLTSQPASLRRQRETANVAAWVNAAVLTERATRTHRRAFVRYVDLLEDWRTAIGRAADQLVVDLDLDQAAAVDEFIDAKLNRSQVSWSDLEVTDELQELAERAWTAMTTLVDRPTDEPAIRDLGRIESEYTKMYDAAEALVSDQTTATVAEARREIRARMEAKLAQTQKHLDLTRTQLKAARVEADRLRAAASAPSRLRRLARRMRSWTSSSPL